MENNYEELGKDCSLCASCGGHCCKSCGCHFSPDDFEDLSFEYLKNKILEGYISIDWYEGDPRPGKNDLSETLFLRIRNKKNNKPTGFAEMLEMLFQTAESISTDEPANIVDPSWGGVCILHTSIGCSIPYENRPKGARWLIAKTTEDGRCISKYTKDQCAIDWIPYQETLLKLKDYFMEHPDVPFNNK